MAGATAKPLGGSLPYPNGTLYVPKGLVGVFGGGQIRDLREDLGLFLWQGEFGFFYKPWLSAGAGFRIKAGEPSDIEQKVENRYFVFTRAHRAWNHVAIYAGPQVGVDNLNLTSSPDTGTHDVFSKTGASLGLEFGLGYKPLPWVGVTFGNRFEYSLANLTSGTRSASRTLNVRGMPGLSFDLLPFLPGLKESVSAFTAFCEYQRAFLFIVDHRQRTESAWMAGGSIAF